MKEKPPARVLRRNENLFHQTYKTPLGVMTALGNETFVCVLDFEENVPLQGSQPWVSRLRGSGTPFPLDLLGEELTHYFAGALSTFQTPFFFEGTAFQEMVWRKLASLSYGETLSYGALARMLSCPKGARAVGKAVGANPLLLLLPCHRVVGSHGLGGYRGGLPRKKWLLSHEMNS